MKNYQNRLIIFSKNRACQLNLLLESIEKYSNNIFDDIIILYTADTEYLNGYEKLKNLKNSDNIIFYKEKNFKSDLLNLIDDSYNLTTFMVDDAVLFNHIDINKTDINNIITNDIICFSLRLGINCNYSHPANLNYKLGSYEIYERFLRFDYTKQEPGDFRYPLSTDGHIFNTKLIKNLVSNIDFNNPNTLEANLQRFVMLNNIPKTVICFTESKLVSIPANLVNNTFNNRHGLEFAISESELNSRFISGEIIDLDNMDFSNINGPHKEIKYEFKKG